MDVKKVTIFGIAILIAALITAKYYQKQGYPFWRTFVLSSIGYLGLGLLIVKILF